MMHIHESTSFDILRVIRFYVQRERTASLKVVLVCVYESCIFIRVNRKEKLRLFEYSVYSPDIGRSAWPRRTFVSEVITVHLSCRNKFWSKGFVIGVKRTLSLVSFVNVNNRPRDRKKGPRPRVVCVSLYVLIPWPCMFSLYDSWSLCTALESVCAPRIIGNSYLIHIVYCCIWESQSIVSYRISRPSFIWFHSNIKDISISSTW